MLQSAVSGASAYAGACIVVLFELFRGSTESMLTSFLSLPENDDEDEIFFDADQLNKTIYKVAKLSDVESNDPDSESKTARKSHGTKRTGSKPSLIKVEATDKFEVKKEAILVNDTLNAEEQVYDPRKRDSKYARAERSSLWEAVTLAAH